MKFEGNRRDIGRVLEWASTSRGRSIRGVQLPVQRVERLQLAATILEAIQRGRVSPRSLICRDGLAESLLRISLA